MLALRSRWHYKVPVEKVNFKILQYHAIKREQKDPKGRPKNLQHLTFEDKRASILLLGKTETAGLEIRKVVP